MCSNIGKGVLNSHLGSSVDPCYMYIYSKPCYNKPCYKEVQLYKTVSKNNASENIIILQI